MSAAINAFDQIEVDAARWRAFLDANFDDLVAGLSKNPPGWWRQEPGESSIEYMFRIFPVVRPH